MTSRQERWARTREVCRALFAGLGWRDEPGWRERVGGPRSPRTGTDSPSAVPPAAPWARPDRPEAMD